MRSPLTVHAAFSAAASHLPSRIAVRFEGRDLTYGEIERDSRALAADLLASGLRPGEPVGVLMANCPEFYVAVLGISRAGLVTVPVPARATEREVAHVRSDSGLERLLLREDVGPLVRRGLSRSAVADADDEDAPFFFGYTSGTTGRPKAAVVTQRARTINMLVLGQEYGCYTGSDVNLVVTPLYHGAGLTRGLTPLAFGGTVVLHERFDAERALAEMAGGITATFMVPTMFAALLELPAQAPGSLHTILSNASALPEHLKLGILDRWPDAGLFEIYGSTEAGTVTSLRPADQRRKQRCVGRPLALTRVRLENPVDGVGELWSQSPLQFTHYHGNAAATADALRDGWVTGGDLARIDEEGYVHIVGRVSDVIISGGVNVYPREVEEVLAEHPSVREAAVVGVSDDRWGERVHAVVVLTPAAVPDERVLDAHCRRLLAPAKIPRSFSFASSLPRTGSGKVIKDDLGVG